MFIFAPINPYHHDQMIWKWIHIPWILLMCLGDYSSIRSFAGYWHSRPLSCSPSFSPTTHLIPDFRSLNSRRSKNFPRFSSLFFVTFPSFWPLSPVVSVSWRPHRSWRSPPSRWASSLTRGASACPCPSSRCWARRSCGCAQSQALVGPAWHCDIQLGVPPKSCGYPKFAGWFQGKSHRSKWIITRGSPMTSEKPQPLLVTWWASEIKTGTSEVGWWIVL